MTFRSSITQFSKMLKNLSGLLDKAKVYADSKKVEESVLLNSRLAPDQFALVRQLQIACDTAKLGAARLSGKQAPTHDDKETTFAQIQSRISEVVAYLEGFSDADFAGAAEREVTQPRWEGKSLTGAQYLEQHATPNFYFHLATAYAILRHNGVDVGKRDYLGEMPFKKP